MRNILEATNTYKQRKTNSFSGKTVTYRLPLSGNYFTGITSYPFPMAILPSRSSTATYFYKASGYKTQCGLNSCTSPFQVKPRLLKRVEFISYLYALKLKPNKYYSYSGVLTTFCRTHKRINKIDCTITPESILNHEEESVNRFVACTLGEVPVKPDYLTQISLFQRVNGIRPAIRSLN